MMSDTSRNTSHNALERAEGMLPDNSDAELLLACAEFDNLQSRHRAVNYEVSSSTLLVAADAESDQIVSAQQVLVSRMGDLQACTLAGKVARAHSLVAWDGCMVGQGSLVADARLICAVIRDLIGSGQANNSANVFLPSRKRGGPHADPSSRLL